MHYYVFSLLCRFHDSVFSYLSELHGGLKMGVIHPLFMLLLLLALLRLVQVLLVMLGRMPGYNIEIYLLIFVFVFCSVLVGYLMNCPLWAFFFS